MVYQIDPQEKLILDECESLGVGYDEEEVEVMTAGGSMSAWMYVARPSAVESNLKPYGWYMDFIVEGAHLHRLPYCYIADILRMESAQDPDSSRHEANQRILELIR